MILGALFSKAQQDPMYTQYIFNLQTVNPAYAGTWGTLGFMGLSRHQWVGFSGHPTTQTFSMQMPLTTKNVGVGINVIYDKVGLETKISASFDYSYKIDINDVTTLRFGIKGGFTNYSNNMTTYTQYPDGFVDPAFETIVANKFMPNVGVGIYWDAPKYFFGLSLPKIIENSFQSNVTNFSTKSEIRHFFLTGGMIFELSDFLKFKPTVMTHVVGGAPFQFDISANFLLANKVWLGGMYRSGDAISLMAQWVVSPSLRIGYAHDFTTTELSNYHQGVHEIMLSYEFALSRRKFVSPRYF
jgi:type IX secretion system PorP/SprF family membrane protein